MVQEKIEIKDNNIVQCPKCKNIIKGKDNIRFLQTYNMCKNCTLEQMLKKEI